MRSIPQVLLWETFSRGRWSVPGLFLLGNAIPLFTYGALSGFGVSFATPELPFIVLQFSFLPLIILQFAIGIAIAQGSMSRLFAWPISSNAIVAWHAITGAIVLAAETALAVSLYNWLFHAEWPVFGPMLFAGVVWTAVQLLQFIRVQSSLSGVCFWSSPLLLLLLWLASRYGAILSPPTHYWRETTVGDMLMLVIIAAICYAMAWAGVRITRPGGRLPHLGFSEWLTRRWESLTFGSSIRSSFRSAADAQDWYEYKLRGWALPFIASIMALLVVLGVVLRFVITRDWNMGKGGEIGPLVPLFLAWLSVFAMIWGGIVAMEDSSNPGEKRDHGMGDFYDSKTHDSMGSFLAVLPIENRLYSDVILRRMAINAASMLFPVLPILMTMWLANRAPSSLTVPGIGLWWMPMMLVIPWLGMANAASFAFIARRGAAYLFGGAFVVGVSLFIARELLASDAFLRLLVVGTTVLSILIMMLTIWVFDRCRRANQLPARTQLLCLALVVGIIGAAIVFRPIDPPMVAYPLTLAVAALAVLPFAALPLAIGASRHR